MPVVGPDRLGDVVRALDAGQVAGVPTDTVYGLAARLDRPDALDAVFSIKGRPPGLALPVLVAGVDEAARLSAWTAAAARLAARWWPGPLTLVVPARPDVGRAVGGDGRSVGLRHPRNDLVVSLCHRCGPLAVTSANRHRCRPAATAAEVVDAFPLGGEAELAGSVAVVLDGGRCDGEPSTVVDCALTPPTCVRRGALAWPELAMEAGVVV